MKIRKGFVSNSSTTSFTCDACGEVLAFHDSCSDEDMGITRFSCGHSTCSCTEVSLSGEKNKKLWRESAEKELRKDLEEGKSYGPSQEDVDRILEIEDFDEFVEACRDWEIYNPSSLCPVCSFKKFNDDLVYRYILVKHKLNLKDVRKEMKKNFKSFDEFQAWIEENEK